MRKHETDDEILQDVLAVKGRLGIDLLTGREYYKHGKFGKKAIVRHFGSWGKLADKLGLKKTARLVEHSEEELFGMMTALWDKLGRPPTREEYSEYTGHGKRYIDKRFKSWGDFCSRFLKGRNAMTNDATYVPQFSWIPFYSEFADKLIEFRDDRSGLLKKLNAAYHDSGVNLKSINIILSQRDIDPFTVFAIFNYTDAHGNVGNAIKILASIKKEFGLANNVPTDFTGVTCISSMSKAFYKGSTGKGKTTIDNLMQRKIDGFWQLFVASLLYATDKSQINRDEFVNAFNQVNKYDGVKWCHTMALYWIRPYEYVNLDGSARSFLRNVVKSKIADRILYTGEGKEKDQIPGDLYLGLCDGLKREIKDTYQSFPKLSQEAREKTQSKKKMSRNGDNPINELPKEVTEEKKVSSQEEGYTDSKFLEQVFMEKQNYDELVSLLKKKKNLIFMGVPGVGKTFVAKRLAWAMMGGRFADRVAFVQFHQSYSYEDFICGYKPVEGGGFKLVDGVFFAFCKRAAADPEKSYFFIIDEINRGNISKIFGELLMTIEADKRGDDGYAVRLAYRSGETFVVPKNLYIIGMMNTADRSLAMMDYALRRRFSFYLIEPRFETEGFKALLKGKTKMQKLVECVKDLNKRIATDPSLGPGFVIGHSYFCGDSTPEEIVRFDIVPMLSEYWFDNAEKVKAEEEKLMSALK